MNHCDECGFDYESVAPDTIADELRGFARRYRAPLTRFLPGEDPSTLLRAHPIDGTWSALEYACHVRDVFLVQRERLARGLAENTPELEPMRREERVHELRYNEQDPSDVAGAIDAATTAMAEAFEALTPAERERTVVYQWPERAERTLTWIGRHTVHEGSHHLLDIGRVLRAARGR